MKRIIAILFLSLLVAFSVFSQGENDLSKYILTPKEKPTPRINGARVVGVRPGSEFLFKIAATGKRPMTFEAKNLPKGLSIDKQSGIISGKVKKRGEFVVNLTALNEYGEYHQTLRIKVGDEIALTPPMGWNSWNCWGQSVSQEKVLSSARALIEKGLDQYGWTYMNIDDGWQGKRGGKYNAIQPNKKFPDMKALSDELHGMGLKLGIYSTPWVGTYAGHIGSYSDNEDGTYQWIEQGINCTDEYKFERPNWKKERSRREHYYHGRHSFVKNDVKQWVEWGVDYLKYDWNPNDLYYTKEMSDALRESGRDIIYSISNHVPFADIDKLWPLVNCYRTTGDIRDTWKSILKLGFTQERWRAFHHPGHWADPDMLVVGTVGWGPKLHNTKLTVAEQYTHISLWALLASPLLIGCDIASMDEFTRSLLTNSEVIDINQDPLGVHAAALVLNDNEAVYAKHLEDGSLAVGLFNLSSQPRRIKISQKILGTRGEKTLRDVWRQQDIYKWTSVDDTFEAEIEPHGTMLLTISPKNYDQKTEGFSEVQLKNYRKHMNKIGLKPIY
ncbi:MAG: putative Ig domain-containing protein [Alistipes sp.]|nr:putative Ig domain-containing protein [Candidatus Alistipes equi]